MATSIVDFYSGRFKHPSGRTIEGVLEMDDDALEAAHDVIQYLFPLTERSQCQPHSPVLSRAEVEEFRSSKELKVMLSASLGRMLKFYGLSVVMDAVGPVVWRGPGWDERSPNWLQKGDHNHLRLTRMVKSLKLLGTMRMPSRSSCWRRLPGHLLPSPGRLWDSGPTPRIEATWLISAGNVPLRCSMRTSGTLRACPTGRWPCVKAVA